MPLPIALLLHEFPAEPPHVDLLIAVEGRPLGDHDRSAETWRCPRRPDALAIGERLTIERIGDHRALYLRLSAGRELGDNRGRVSPLRTGEAVRSGDLVDVRWLNAETMRWRLKATDRGWQLTCVESARSDPEQRRTP